MLTQLSQADELVSRLQLRITTLPPTIGVCVLCVCVCVVWVGGSVGVF
jgi:hypothetical protein